MGGQKTIYIAAAFVVIVVIGGVAVYYPSQQRAAIAQNSSNTTTPANNSTLSSAPTPFPADTMQYNLTYAEWTARWWQWVVSIPADRNPATDVTGQNCHQGQSGPVWFLAGTFAGQSIRNCDIPAGKSILFPVLNNECSYAEYPELQSESQLRSCAVSPNDDASQLMVEIDGQVIDQSQLRRIESPLFTLTLPENNIFEIPATTTQAVSDGFWVFLPPLEPGQHEIHSIGATIDYTNQGQNNFLSDVLNHIRVVQ